MCNKISFYLIKVIIPGAYHVFIIIVIWSGVEGWTYEMLPDIDN